jgi:replication-associated recombination protein RarA
VLERLSDANISQIQRDAIARITVSMPADASDRSHAISGIALATDEVVDYITNLSNGDARTALNLLELVLQAPSGTTSQKIYATLKNTTMSRHAHDSK